MCECMPFYFTFVDRNYVPEREEGDVGRQEPLLH